MCTDQTLRCFGAQLFSGTGRAINISLLQSEKSPIAFSYTPTGWAAFAGA